LKDKELVDAIAQIQNGSQKAQTKLINYFWDDVFGFILKKVQDRTIADELTVAVFAKILTKLNLYDENFQTYLIDETVSREYLRRLVYASPKGY